MIAALAPLRFGDDGSLKGQAIALDVHAHILPVEALRRAEFAGVRWDVADETLSIDDHRIGVRDLYFPQLLIEWMDANSIERALISIPPPAYRQHLPASSAEAWAACINDGLLEVASQYSDRLEALLHLPIEHPEASLNLLRSIDMAAIAGFAIAGGGVTRNDLGAETCIPVWQALDDADAFVFLHPAGCCDERLARFYLENLVGNPYETTVAAAQLIMAGIPARFPKIRFCLAHAGGFLPAVCGRLQRGRDSARPGVPVDIEAPLISARRFFVDCIGHHPESVGMARAIVGEEHVLFGSDWPFPMGNWPDEVKCRP